MGERVAFDGTKIRPVHGITGSAIGNAGSLYANGNKVVHIGAEVDEGDENIGSVTEGNAEDVYFNGESISKRGSWTQTHQSYVSMLETDYSPNVYIGYLRNGGMRDLTDRRNLIDGQAPPVIEVGEGTDYEVQTRSWRDNWGWRTQSSGENPDSYRFVHQASWTELSGSDIGTNWGNHKGCILFPDYLLRECLGKSIESIELFLKRNDSQGYAHEISLDVHTHTLSSLFPEPNTGLPMNEPPLSNRVTNWKAQDGRGWNRSEEKWATLPSSYNNLLSEGKMTGVAFYVTYGSGNETRYLHFNKNVRVRVTFG